AADGGVPAWVSGGTGLKSRDVEPDDSRNLAAPARRSACQRRSRSQRDERRDRRSRRPRAFAHGAPENAGRTRPDLLHGLRRRQGSAARGQSTRGVVPALEAARSFGAGAHRRSRGKAAARRVRCLLRDPRAPKPTWRVGIAAVANAARPRDARPAGGGRRPSIQRTPRAAAGEVGRLPGGAGHGGVLVCARASFERAPSLGMRRRRVARTPAVPVMRGPRRIVCLTEEPTEVLYALGEQDRIVGISGFTVRPQRARKEKPKVSAFTSANIDKILALQPDMAIGFSDIQADIARELVKAGVEVWISNHRSVDGILDYVRRLGALVGAHDKAETYARGLEAHVGHVRALGAALPRHPRVYFEEWDEPPITGIRWVAELIRIAGGEDVFPELAEQPLAKN